MGKLKINTFSLAVLVILIIAGSYFVYTAYLSQGSLHRNQPQDPEFPGNQSPIPVADSGSLCSPESAAPRLPVPVDTSIPVRDPMPGIRYSLNEGESGKAVVLQRGDIVEITLRWAPGVAWSWDILVSGCGIEMVNDGYYSDGGDFWNNTGHYRARYRAVSPGTSVIAGIFGVPPNHKDVSGAPRFNLTVIVK